MAVKDATAVADKWARNLAASTPSITDGVNAVTVSPGAKAAQAVDKWQARLIESRDKWVRAVQGTTLEYWRAQMLGKGIQRIAQGANDAKPKFVAFMTDFLPYVESGAATVRAMPNLTVEDGIARSAAMIRHNAAYQRNRRAF